MVALVFCGDLKYCPYISRYIERLENAHVDYKVYFWNRSKFDLQLTDHYICYNKASKLTNDKVQKLLDFIGFRKWLINELKINQHEKIIALSTLTGVLLGSFLYKKKGHYIFDIRDYSYEHIKPFFVIEKKVIENSAFTAISSRGFNEFLPEHEYVIAHNFNRNDIKEIARFEKTEGTINFVWNGVVRYFEFQRYYLDALKNDSRFTIVFHGDGPELDLYKKYCLENGFTNVLFTGAYNNADKALLLKEAHILNNCYGYTQNAGNKLKYAVSNRFYDGMIYHIPQLVEPEGFKTTWATESGIGVSFPPDKDFAKKLYDYYQNIESNLFDEACSSELEHVVEDDNKYVEMIDRFIIDRGE
ncbi:MAG: glycosyltransferase family 4 protein [Lachnospiraceae bacterium]|nr:glycosyltransferase family 4 protein [Lachnospiraceae bacterium]